MPVLAPEAPVTSPHVTLSVVPPLYIAVADWWQDLKVRDRPRYAAELAWFEVGARARKALTGNWP